MNIIWFIVILTYLYCEIPHTHKQTNKQTNKCIHTHTLVRFPSFFLSFFWKRKKERIKKYHHHHHHHHVVQPARISLTLSRHFSLSFIASGRFQGYIPYPHRAAVYMFELVVLLLLGQMWWSIGVHKSHSITEKNDFGDYSCQTVWLFKDK